MDPQMAKELALEELMPSDDADDVSEEELGEGMEDDMNAVMGYLLKGDGDEEDDDEHPTAFPPLPEDFWAEEDVASKSQDAFVLENDLVVDTGAESDTEDDADETPAQTDETSPGNEAMA